MLEKIKAYWKNLDQDVVVNGQSLVIGMVAIALSGVMLGLSLGSGKQETCCGCCQELPQDDENEEE